MTNICLPDFCDQSGLCLGCGGSAPEEKPDCSAAECLNIDEGECIRIMHMGAFDDESTTRLWSTRRTPESGCIPALLHPEPIKKRNTAMPHALR